MPDATPENQPDGQRERPRTLLVMRDLMDNQLEGADGVKIGRIADIELAWPPDGGAPRLGQVVAGPEALSKRVVEAFMPLVHAVFRGRFERRIPIADLENTGPTITLRRPARDYPIGQSERWIAARVLRHIPGSGYRHEPDHQPERA
jgi:hypothetical protein